ncbi:hypothetical protein [Defluviicoccus vanus]|uniref:Uncharacterized protein n=1 Tax=Defluviicoccus vanus TaxID=111831 RepID=A0A7H1MXX4_9PROT|nr:hypothetical protein [Defluviicoccus vanus]QNT68310.1 hypothetical protein HQ394_01720 [Defluviicoccus vanus]
MRRLGGALLAAVPAFWLGGCAEQLYVGSDTVLGIAVGYNTAREAARVDIGYDRHFVTWIPQSVPVTDAAGSGREAMSVIGCTEVKIGNLNLQKFQESLAIGKAAEDFAKKLENNPLYFPCYKHEDGAS